ncbi:acetyl-CoA carboxylase biotin carboxyl carrier protein subunit [Ornithinibacillus halophilus]|uniref:Acetyl-CoA carboxylase biotin carboxyl carrier protein n=1 Tax=Ornithinibacillus halophilus TaxID=930117 RepID=A0A1M5GKI9_9BACI|nr:acetyl-CoA carboxylase biotin carboxyl carrier protein subunit [Ornithinibacillus halophilus]SHG04265.1 acetyl-CoA carboxylase biotin carboxyl carrier protein [Ornithinibacillus halophilus]
MTVDIKSIMSGSVWKINVSKGDLVTEGTDLVILESMKMEVPIEATEDGIVKEILVSEGEFVSEDDVVVVIDK